MPNYKDQQPKHQQHKPRPAPNRFGNKMPRRGNPRSFMMNMALMGASKLAEYLPMMMENYEVSGQPTKHTKVSAGFTPIEMEKKAVDDLDQGSIMGDQAVKLANLKFASEYMKPEFFVRGGLEFTGAEMNKHTDDEPKDYDLGNIVGGKAGIIAATLGMGRYGMTDDTRDYMFNFKKEKSLLTFGDEDPPLEMGFSSRDARTGRGYEYAFEPNPEGLIPGRFKHETLKEKPEYLEEVARSRELYDAWYEQNQAYIRNFVLGNAALPGGEGMDPMVMQDFLNYNLNNLPSRKQALSERNKKHKTDFKDLLEEGITYR